MYKSLAAPHYGNLFDVEVKVLTGAIRWGSID